MRRLRHLSMPGFRPTINLFEGFGYDPRQADEDDQYRNFGGLETLVVEEVHIRLIELAARSGRLHLSILGGPLPLPGASPHERWSGIENLTVSAIYLTGQEANLPIFHNVTHLTCLHDHGIESVEAARTFFDTFPVLRVLTLPGEGSARDYTAGTKEWDTVPVLPLSLRRLIVTRTTKWTDEDRLRLREACEARQLDLVSL